MSKRVRGAATQATTMAAVGAAAALGLVWISIWAVGALTQLIGDWAPLALGLVLCAPVLTYALVHKTKAQAPPSQPLLRSDTALVADAAGAAKRLFAKSPAAALAVAALAGLIAVRTPDALSSLMHMFEDERAD